MSDLIKYSYYGNYYFLIRHVIIQLLGLSILILILYLPIKIWIEISIILFIINILLLVIVVLINKNLKINGACRWINIGFINFQPSEMMKLNSLLYVSKYILYKKNFSKNFKNYFLPILIVLIILSILLLMEPDLGNFIVIFIIIKSVLFISGCNLKNFLISFLFLISLIFIFILLSSWRKLRVFSYLNPWDKSNFYGISYQLSHSLIALGRGGLFGVGIGNSIEKLHYLPEAHTDFLFSILGEELGFFGIVLIINLYTVIIYKSFKIGIYSIKANKIFSGLVAQGIGIWIGFQIFINIGMCIGILPTKGITLPFMSYGGSGIITNFFAISILLRIDIENKLLKKKKNETK